MQTRWRAESDQWTTEGEKITAPETLATIEKTLDEEGPVLVQHWHYRGGSAPHWFVFSEYEDFTAYLEKHAFAGDAIDVWSVHAVCKWKDRLVGGKCPAEDGCIPKGGAY